MNIRLIILLVIAGYLVISIMLVESGIMKKAIHMARKRDFLLCLFFIIGVAVYDIARQSVKAILKLST
jgi:uncharacterized membrane protein